MSLAIDRYLVPNGDGWKLELKRSVSPEHFNPALRPLLILPGYGMNAYIFGWPEQGASMERCLAEQGFEVWSGGLRHQGRSERVEPGAGPPGLRAYAETDLPALLAELLDRSRTEADLVDVIGASLGGAVVFAHLALDDDSLVGNVVAMGAPLRWEKAHPMLTVMFRSRRLAKILPMRGTDKLARLVFPFIGRVAPQVLSIYMNLDHVDINKASELTRTVDEPHRLVNRDIASWVRAKDMVLRSINITKAMADVHNPLLVIYANADGIVPPETATSVVQAWGGRDVTVWEIGTDEDWYAHADLFIAPDTPRKVFAPMAEWLRQRAT